MRQSIQISIAKVFMQIFFALVVFSLLIGFSNANAAIQPSGYIVTYQEIDSDKQDARLAGRLRSTIAFDRALSEQAIMVQVKQGVVTLSGQVEHVELAQRAVAHALSMTDQSNIIVNVEIKHAVKSSAKNTLILDLLSRM